MSGAGRKRAVSAALPTEETVRPLTGRTGVNHDLRSHRRSGRDVKFNTNITEELHQWLKEEAVRARKPIGALLDDMQQAYLAAQAGVRRSGK
jgi:hypothetical protein